MSQVSHSLRWLVLCHLSGRGRGRAGQRVHDALLLSRHHLGDLQGSSLSPFGLPYPAARQLLHNRPGGIFVVVWFLSFRFCCFVLWTPGSLWLPILSVQLSLTVWKEVFLTKHLKGFRLDFYRSSFLIPYLPQY